MHELEDANVFFLCESFTSEFRESNSRVTVREIESNLYSDIIILEPYVLN